MTEDRGLTDALHRRADQLGTTHPLSLEDVQGRARGIRRRRTAVSGLAAAAVLAVAVPVGLSLDGTDEPGRTPAVASTGVKDGVLTTDVDVAGGEPGIPYLYDGEIHLPEGGTIPVEGDWTGFDTLGEGFVVSDGRRLAVLGADGQPVIEQPTDGARFAVSADRTLVAHVSDGGVQTLDGDGNGLTLPVPPEIRTPQLVAVQGSETCDPDSEGGGCVFFLNDGGPTPGGWSLTSKGIVNPLGTFLSLSDVSDTGQVAGMTSIDELEPSACHEVWNDAFGEGPAWESCEHRVIGFSPDGTQVSAGYSYADGAGDGSLAILDAADGAVLAEWTNSEEHQAWATSVGWDTDGTVLGMVTEGEDQALMRFSPDGGLSKVMDVEGDYSEATPLLLPQSS